MVICATNALCVLRFGCRVRNLLLHNPNAFRERWNGSTKLTCCSSMFARCNAFSVAACKACIMVQAFVCSEIRSVRRISTPLLSARLVPSRPSCCSENMTLYLVRNGRNKTTLRVVSQFMDDRCAPGVIYLDWCTTCESILDWVFCCSASSCDERLFICEPCHNKIRIEFICPIPGQ